MIQLGTTSLARPPTRTSLPSLPPPDRTRLGPELPPTSQPTTRPRASPSRARGKARGNTSSCMASSLRTALALPRPTGSRRRLQSDSFRLVLALTAPPPPSPLGLFSSPKSIASREPLPRPRSPVLSTSSRKLSLCLKTGRTPSVSRCFPGPVGTLYPTRCWQRRRRRLRGRKEGRPRGRRGRRRS
ncbi:hypothetical protein GUITHDRAFT_156017, partial [Guillardia theta CCMP2712]